MASLVKQYPETGSEALWSFINNEIFAIQKKEAIACNWDYAFETNFSAVDPMNSVREFKVAGYETHLIFLGLNSLEESLQRVAYRVKTGGHKVSEKSVKYNFEYGLKNLYKYFHEFDSVTLLDNSIADSEEPVTPSEILYIFENKLFLQTKIYPKWVKPVIDKVFN